VLIVGSPGKVIRELSDEEVAHLPGSAQRYVQNWQRYRLGLVMIWATLGFISRSPLSQRFFLEFCTGSH